VNQSTMRVNGGVYLLPNTNHTKLMRVRRVGPTRWAVDVATFIPSEMIGLNEDGLIVGISKAAGMSADELGEMGYTGAVTEWTNTISTHTRKIDAVEYAQDFKGIDHRQPSGSDDDGPESLKSLLRF